MASQLLEYRAFRVTIECLDFVLGQLPNPPPWAIFDALSGNCEEHHIQLPQVSQVACTAIKIGLVDLLASWSVRPVAVVGHSSGEMAAAYASGRLTAAEAIASAYFRGQGVSTNKKKGAMLAVGLSNDEISGYLDDRESIKIAAFNSPGSITLSGDAEAVQLLSHKLTGDGVFNRILKTGGNAYHSHHMASLGGEFEDMLTNEVEHLKKCGPTWDARLRKAGFSGTNIFLDDYACPYETTSILVSIRLEEQHLTDLVERNTAVIHLLHDVTGPPTLLGRRLAAKMGLCGASIKISTIDNALEDVPTNSRVIVFLSSRNDLFDGNEARLRSFQYLARSTKSMIWLTSSGIIKGRDARGSLMTGLLRTIATENPDVDSEENEDRELAWQDGCMWISRVVPDSGLTTYTERVKTLSALGTRTAAIGDQGAIRAAFETPGILASLYFRPYSELLQPLPVDYIDVEVAAVRVNWEDLALASSRFDAKEDNLSSEYAGVVTRIGANVVGLSIGDRVYGVGRGHFGTHTRVPAILAHKLQFDPTARYVITGGLGGLDRSLINWMSERGAHDFVVLSRRGVNTVVASLLVDSLATRGVRIESVICDVSKREDVMSAIKGASSASRLVKGVVHAALSLSDLSFEKPTIDQWQSGLAAKTLGTVNLHEATQTLPLDFFVMLTSTESIWAPPTQSSYIAATNFQGRYRQRLGLPASTVAYGLVGDIDSDFKHGSLGTADMYARNKALTTTEWNALASLEPAFLSQPSTSWIGRNDDPLSLANYYTCLDPAALAQMASTGTPRWYNDARVSLIIRAMKDVEKQDGGNDDSSTSLSSTSCLRHAFDEAIRAGPEKRASTVALVVEGIMNIISEMLFVDIANISPNKSVAKHGVDSLIAAELRHWFHQALRINLQMSDLLDAQTSIRVLAENVVDESLKE
ncbi:hypothetical protein O1611_g8303 [Lasiodiplodia mahajangana]|uniref:Uncharacterized protein n=1 Tax=Lasiodiplodia mahajangana TaxID=1108764 RepID=A0ACC2JD34_9PEZI|nr:hypothetical protein O1611_g8303 [Lasiodiplodia mahajangana]